MQAKLNQVVGYCEDRRVAIVDVSHADCDSYPIVMTQLTSIDWRDYQLQLIGQLSAGRLAAGDARDELARVLCSTRPLASLTTSQLAEAAGLSEAQAARWHERLPGTVQLRLAASYSAASSTPS